MMNMGNIIEMARQELLCQGFIPQDVKADGQKHRCPLQDKPHAKDGEYCIHTDSPPTLYWKNYRTDEYGTKVLLNPTSKVLESATADKIRNLLATACNATDAHPYLVSKGVIAPPGLKMKDGNLLVPARNPAGQVTTLQFIQNDGSKRFMKDSKVQEASCMIKGHASSSAIYLVEGLATGVSVWRALEQQADVLVCFSAGNLKPVAKAVRGKYLECEIIICADNDRYTPGNPGFSKAMEAAKEINGKLICPTFPESIKGTDFNDLHLNSGLEEVACQLKCFCELEQAPSNGLKALGLDEFISWPIPPREYLLYPILSEQGLALIYALRGLGKTYVALCIGLAVAAGRSLFNWNAELPHKVLYIDGEMPARTMQERLQRLVQTLNIAPEYQSNFALITPDIQKQPMPNLATPEGQREIEPYLHNVALVIIDNIATLCRAGRENETESWLPVQGWLLDLRRRGISVLIVHHAGKNGDQRGTSAKEDIMDTVINLRRPKDYEADEGARFEVHLTKARGLCGSEASPFEAQLVDTGSELLWQIRKLENRDQEKVKIMLAQGKTVREIAEEIGISKSSVQRLKDKIDD